MSAVIVSAYSSATSKSWRAWSCLQNAETGLDRRPYLSWPRPRYHFRPLYRPSVAIPRHPSPARCLRFFRRIAPKNSFRPLTLARINGPFVRRIKEVDAALIDVSTIPARGPRPEPALMALKSPSAVPECTWSRSRIRNTPRLYCRERLRIH